MLPNRLKATITKYFNHFPITARSKVKTVTMDLNYYNVIARELFPTHKLF
ncbi:MAG: transposase [Lactobacillus sp.]|nr:transposase [Lactobacillus agrestimuris]MBD5431324.1 transposase [Lactobacillus sp.]